MHVWWLSYYLSSTLRATHLHCDDIQNLSKLKFDSIANCIIYLKVNQTKTTPCTLRLMDSEFLSFLRSIFRLWILWYHIQQQGRQSYWVCMINFCFTAITMVFFSSWCCILILNAFPHHIQAVTSFLIAIGKKDTFYQAQNFWLSHSNIFTKSMIMSTSKSLQFLFLWSKWYLHCPYSYWSSLFSQAIQGSRGGTGMYNHFFCCSACATCTVWLLLLLAKRNCRERTCKEKKLLREQSKQ